MTNVCSEMQSFKVNLDKLLCVSFFHKPDNKTFIRADKLESSAMPRVPIVLFYSTETNACVKFEIRDSFNPD